MNWQVDLWYQFIGMFIISFTFFLIALGILYTYFSTKSSRVHGIILIGLGVFLSVILYFLGNYFIQKGVNVPWWNIFKIEGFFADLGAFFGVIVVIGIIMVIVIQTDRKDI